MRKCAYDECHTFEPQVHNQKYCLKCKCKRKRETNVLALNKELIWDEERWELQQARKAGNANLKQQRDLYLLENKSFAMFDIEATNLKADYGEIICACIRDWKTGKTTTFSIDSGKSCKCCNRQIVKSDAEIVGEIRDELRKYDYVVTWFGTGYDMPYMTTRIMAAGEEPLGFTRHIDLYYTSKFKLLLHSNRLASIGDFAFGQTKKDSIDMLTWLAAMRGDKKSLDYIVNHCKKDVAELGRVFDVLKQHRNIGETALRFY